MPTVVVGQSDVVPAERRDVGEQRFVDVTVLHRLSELARPHLPNLARRLLEHADSTDPNDYFDLFSVEQIQSGAPAPSGYFVGYLVAKRLAAARSLVELVHLRGPELKLSVLSVLEELQKPA